MSDSDSDTAKVAFAPPKIRNASGRPRGRVTSPTLVPSTRPDDDIIRQLQAAVVGTKPKPIDTAKSPDRVEDTSSEIQNAPDQPASLESDIEPPQDTLKLLQELARKNNSLPTVDAPAMQPDMAPAPHSAAAASAGDVKPAHRTAEPQSPERTASRNGTRFAIFCCAILLIAGATGFYLWSESVPAPPAPSAAASVEARSDMPSALTPSAECDIAPVKNPYAAFFVNPSTLGSNGRQTVDPSAEGYGRYSLRSLKTTWDRRDSGC